MLDPMTEEHGTHESAQDPTTYWEERYAERDRIWSGNPNQSLVETVGELSPGRALDLGCGEGGDALWLARQGWAVTAVDISSTAVERGRAAATERGVDGIEWVAADLSRWLPEGEFDLVSACFLHSTVELPRTEILRRMADVVVPGGHLLVVGHAEPPPWSRHRDHHDHDLLSPAGELRELALAAGSWETVVSETRERAATGPDGEQATLEDTVVLLRRH
jgi:ubiquinone/menaquinone biosynthesis C-methylase UbiE